MNSANFIAPNSFSDNGDWGSLRHAMQRLEQVWLQATANCEYPYPLRLKKYVHSKSNEEG
jgi:hypothetical protein